MAAPSFEVRGTDIILRFLDDLVEIVQELGEPVQEFLDLLLERVQHYPPPPPGSSYQRTFQLKSSWDTEVVLDASGELGRVESTGLDYPPYVQDAEKQAPVHQGRWDTVQDIARDEAEKGAEILERYIQEKWNRIP